MPGAVIANTSHKRAPQRSAMHAAAKNVHEGAVYGHRHSPCIIVQAAGKQDIVSPKNCVRTPVLWTDSKTTVAEEAVQDNLLTVFWTGLGDL